MPQLKLADFGKARDIAQSCLYKGNALIQCAEREPQVHGNYTVWRLGSELRSFCEFMNTTIRVIDKVDHYLKCVATEPVRHMGLCYATAHTLAWFFAHNLWHTAKTVVDVELIKQGRSKEVFESSPGFELDEAVVDAKILTIRDALKERKPIDASYFSARVWIEFQKASALFVTGQRVPKESRSGRGRPAGSFVDLAFELRCKKAWDTGNFATHEECARELGPGYDGGDVRRALDRQKARKRRTRQK